MYKVGDMVVIPETKELKKIQEIERFKDDVVIYTTDGNAYGIRECKTVHQAYSHEINNLLNKWKV
jgi:hypothetical protein